MAHFTRYIMQLCFNPRTRKGCDLKGYDVIIFGTHVSIHAPARGATIRDWPARSASARFNPRTREGCDLVGELCPAVQQHVSIHAPARGATPIVGRLDKGNRCFNPRTHEGCDNIAV